MASCRAYFQFACWKSQLGLFVTVLADGESSSSESAYAVARGVIVRLTPHEIAIRLWGGAKLPLPVRL